MAATSVYMKLFWGDLLRDVGHLTAEGFGAYMLTLGHLWNYDGRADEADLIRVSRLQPGSTSWAAVRKFLTQNDDGTLSQKRLTLELAASRARIESASSAGRASVTAKAKNGKPQQTSRIFNGTSTERQRKAQRNVNGSSTVQGQGHSSGSDPDQIQVATRPALPDKIPSFALEVSGSGSDARSHVAPRTKYPPSTPRTDTTEEAIDGELEPATSTQGPPNERRKAPRVPGGGQVYQDAINAFCASWRRFRLADYFVTPADKAQFGRLLQSMPPEVASRLPAAFDAYCGDLDQFVSEQGHSLKYFCTSGAVNKYGSTDRAKGMNSNERKGAMNVMGWVEKKMAAVARGEKI